MNEKRYKEAFERASEERKEKILEVGIEEFASKGYENANINVIAKNAGIRFLKKTMKVKCFAQVVQGVNAAFTVCRVQQWFMMKVIKI